MATVRRGQQTVDIAPLRGGQRRAAATAASEGAGVEQANAQFGMAVGELGDRVARIGSDMYGRLQEQERRASHATALMKASNQISEWENPRLYDPTSGAYAQKGEAALGLPETVLGEFDQLSSTIEAGLSTDAQRLAFAELKQQKRQSLDLNLRRHVAGEIQTFRTQEYESLLKNQINEGIQSAEDPAAVKRSLDTALSAIDTTGPQIGLGPKAIEAQKAAVRSATHVGVINTLLAHEQDGKASEYYAAVKGQIAGDQQDNIVKALEEGSIRGGSQREADAIIAAGGTLTEQRAKAKAIEDPKLRDAVEARIEHNDAVNDRIQREAKEDDERRGYDIIDRTADASKIPAALWSSYSGGTRSAMRGYALTKARGVPVQTDDPQYYALMQQAGDTPAEFAKVNLLQYRAKLDDGDFKQLVSLQLSIKNADGRAQTKDLPEFQTRSRLIDDTLILHGLDPDTKDTEQKRAIAQLRRMVDQRVEFMQGGGKKATNQDIQSEIDSILSKSVKVPGSWWNMFPGGKSVSDQKKRLIDATIDDVPANDRAQIEAALRARGKPVSDATVLNVYVEAQVRKP